MKDLGSKQSSPVSEREVVALWQEQLRHRRLFAALDGERIEVLYPGRLNDGRGADFRDALIRTGDRCSRGCIEIHTRTSGWEDHGHHRDPAYNEVVLHVALKGDRPEATRLQNGAAIPTLVLENNSNLDSIRRLPRSFPPCQASFGKSSAAATGVRVLEWAGDVRFHAKAIRFFDELTRMDARQSLYRGVMEALGYSHNKAAFLNLAERLPVSQIESITQEAAKRSRGLVYLQAAMLESAGFSGGPSLAEVGVEQCLLRLGDWKAVPGSGWELFKVRPGNHPVRRIFGLSYLLWRYRDKGFLPALLQRVRSTSVSGTGDGLAEAFLVALESASGRRQVLVGRDRADEIVINVLLPFSWAWSRANREFSVCLKAYALYRHYPLLTSNSIERHMSSQLGLSAGQLSLACRQQGLLHLYKEFCTQGRCDSCELAGKGPFRA